MIDKPKKLVEVREEFISEAKIFHGCFEWRLPTRKRRSMPTRIDTVWVARMPRGDAENHWAAADPFMSLGT